MFPLLLLLLFLGEDSPTTRASEPLSNEQLSQLVCGKKYGYLSRFEGVSYHLVYRQHLIKMPQHCAMVRVNKDRTSSHSD